MAHFAELDSNNVVLRVIVVSDEYENDGANWCNNLLGGTWIQTSYNGRIRKQYAGIGYTYNPEADVFVAPQPYASWSLNETHDWVPPVAKPTDAFYDWDEATTSWVKIAELSDEIPSDFVD